MLISMEKGVKDLMIFPHGQQFFFDHQQRLHRNELYRISRDIEFWGLNHNLCPLFIILQVSVVVRRIHLWSDCGGNTIPTSKMENVNYLRNKHGIVHTTRRPTIENPVSDTNF